MRASRESELNLGAAHSQALVLLAGAGTVTQVPVQWGIHEDVYCAVQPLTVLSSHVLLHPIL